MLYFLGSQVEVPSSVGHDLSSATCPLASQHSITGTGFGERKIAIQLNTNLSKSNVTPGTEPWANPTDSKTTEILRTNGLRSR